MSINTQYTRKRTCEIMQVQFSHFDRQAESDTTSAGGFRPEPITGPPLYGTAELCALIHQLDLRGEGYPIRLAGDHARRLHRALTVHPEAERLALVTLENGNRFALNADVFDRNTGFSSGVPIRETLIVDVRNLKARLARMIESAGSIVGEADDK